jgi:hypothetical protein
VDGQDSPTSDAAGDTEPTRMYVCVCPCGCTAPSTLPWLGESPLARHARCATCGTDRHLAAHPAGDADRDAVHRSRAITDLYVPTPADVAAATEARREVHQEIWTSQWDRWQASLPVKFRNAETSHPKVVECLRRLSIGERGIASLAVLGAPGYGKTWLGVAYANAAIKAGFFKPSQVTFGSESELLASVANSTFGEVEKGLRRLTHPSTQMLIIDDVGRGTWLNEAMRPKVFSLVLDKFWSENRVVVITSNLDPAELVTYIGDGAMDRLRSLAGNASLVLDDEPKRRRVTEEMLARAKQAPAPVVPPPPA